MVQLASVLRRALLLYETQFCFTQWEDIFDLVSLTTHLRRKGSGLVVVNLPGVTNTSGKVSIMDRHLRNIRAVMPLAHKRCNVASELFCLHFATVPQLNNKCLSSRKNLCMDCPVRHRRAVLAPPQG
eukprot:RCo019366